ncbi:hypothetical protein [Clostridium tagluense]|uniref:hypothetical protein n=1 Tax=Clostridium tagluense TaxID=360422 RepID=UPI001CF5D7D3|nr:hypothetical protein [Clostridium tagluense]MCB2300409.1 hypothetical protein [Clostridium tagluense]
MAGISKPIGVKKEALYTVLGGKANKGMWNAITNNGLFNGESSNDWLPPNAYEWYNADDYIEIQINSNFRIWRSGTTSWKATNGKLITKKWNGTSYIDISSSQPTPTQIIENQWELTTTSLPSGKYKFMKGEKGRLDSEWYIERFNEAKFFLKQNNNFYTIKSDQYKDNQFQPLPITIPEKTDYETYGFDDLNLLTQALTVGAETFRPIDKFNKSKPLILYKRVEKTIN